MTTEFPSGAVENTILNLLTASQTSYEYPALQREAVDIISTNLSDSIYATLKQKSIASSTKRCNLLKFLSNICQTPEFHLTTDHYKIYLKGYEREFSKTNCPEAENLSCIISKELDDLVLDVHQQVLNFYKRKYAKREAKMKKQEFIKRIDQEKLNLSLGMHLQRNISHYETSQSLIDDLLKESKQSKLTKSVHNKLNTREYREKQVQFCYAIINIGSDVSDMKVLESILERYSTYNLLESFEIKLLTDLWLMGHHLNVDLSQIVTDKFSFVIDKLVIQFCTDVVTFQDSSEVIKYFSNLDTNPKILRLRDVCSKNPIFYSRLKNLIFELYIFSYCNENVYRFSDYII